MTENKKYIMISGKPIEVSDEVYCEYHRMDRHDRYLEERDQVHGKTLYSNLDTAEMLGEEMISDSNAVNTEDAAIANILHKDLHQCLKLLSTGENELIKAIYFDGLTEREYAKLIGVSQNAVNKQKHRILDRLKIFMKF